MNRIIRGVLPVAVLAAGVGAAVVLMKTGPKTKKAPSKVEATLVEIMQAESSRKAVDVRGMGTIVAARSVTLKSEVPGRVVWLHPNLVQGGRFNRNDLLFKIDDRDFVLAVEQQTSNVQRARVELAQERGRGRVAEREWKLLGSSAPSTAEGKALALREPQLQSAIAALASAQSGLEIAKLNVQRTKVRAPFSAFVQSEQIEMGQLVDKATVLGTLVGTDEFWAQVSLPVAELKWVQQPDASGTGGSTATVYQRLAGGGTIEREARVVRLAGDLDPKGRMARLVVAIKSPMDGPDDQLPLLLGAYVEVAIHGKNVDDVIVLPRRAVRSGDIVWVMNTEDRLEIRPVQVVFRGEREVYLDRGINEGERVILSRLSTPVEGMALRLPTTRGAEGTIEPQVVVEQ